MTGRNGPSRAGHDVVVGRDLRADMRITHPLISRAHLLLRFDQGRWLAIDNGSLNGTFVNGRRVPVVDIHDGASINIGNPDGPSLRFEVGRHRGMAGRPPANRVDAHRPGRRDRLVQLSGRSPPVAAPPAPPPGRPATWAGPPPRPHPGPPGQPAHPAGGAPPRPGAPPPGAPPPANFQPHPQMSGVGHVGAESGTADADGAQRRQVGRDVGVQFGDQDVSGVAAVSVRGDRKSRPARPRSAVPPTTTSSSRTSWRRAITRS